VGWLGWGFKRHKKKTWKKNEYMVVDIKEGGEKV
jgi:hypothetical protein